MGRCLWALGYSFANAATPQNVKDSLGKLIERALPNCLKLLSPRAKAYAIVGLSYLDEEKTNDTIKKLTVSLADQYDHYKDGDWHWFEESITYCNAILPWAILSAGRVMKDDRYLQIGFESLEFLKEKTFREGYFKPIGCKGWLDKGSEGAEFDEQPVEACETTLAYLEAYTICGDKIFFDRAKACFSWYSGSNSKNLSLIDAETGGCYDGIISEGSEP